LFLIPRIISAGGGEEEVRGERGEVSWEEEGKGEEEEEGSGEKGDVRGEESQEAGDEFRETALPLANVHQSGRA
jgi:hypothetical protein